jgi:hypothetical protein
MTQNVMLSVFGACAVTFMMVMYALEGRGRRFVLAFAVGCALSSTYGFLAGTWPFGIVEAIWSVVAIKRYLDQRSAARGGSDHPPPVLAVYSTTSSLSGSSGNARSARDGRM